MNDIFCRISSHILAGGVFFVSFLFVLYFTLFFEHEPKTLSAKMYSVQHTIVANMQDSVDEVDGLSMKEDVFDGDVVVNDELMEGSKEGEYESFTFVVIGDSEREKSPYGFGENAYGVIDRVNVMHPDFVLFTGDVIMANADPRGPKASIGHVRNVFDTHLSKVPYYIVFGYHDVECGTNCVDLWQEYFFDKKYIAEEKRILYYSFDHENTHFIVLSTDFPEKRTITAEQLIWLEEDLEKNELENVIIAMHVPPVTFYEESAEDCHDLACQPELQKKLQNIFKKGDVDLVISGHEAVFDHKIVDGIDYILSGNTLGGKAKYKGVKSGQTFSKVSVNGNMIMVWGIDMEDGILREIRVK